MLCDHCHKQEAIIHIQEIRPDGRNTLNLCLPCAIKRLSGLQGSLKAIEGASALAGLGGLLGALPPNELISRMEQLFSNAKAEDRECPCCHRKLSEFTRDWQLGCQSCADTFAAELREHLEQVHNCEMPPLPEPPTSLEDQQVREIQRLHDELEQAIRNENYERAAYLRDLLAEYSSDMTQNKKD